MCNFMGIRVSRNHYIKLKKIEKELGTLAALATLKDGFRYEISPVVIAKGDDMGIVNMHWEFIPWWIKNEDELKLARKQGIPWLNATSEKLLESKMFKDAALKRRCLVLATHFYEWRHFLPEGEKKEKAYPYAVQLKSQELFYMAGIWQPWTDKSTGEVIDTFAIVTTQANELMQKVHNKKKRMPTILSEELAYEWIMDDLNETRIKEIASFQFPAEQMEAYTIRKDFKQAENPLEPFIFEELIPL